MATPRDIARASLSARALVLKQREEQLDAEKAILDIEGERLDEMIINNRNMIIQAQLLMQESQRASQLANLRLNRLGREDLAWGLLTSESTRKSIQVLAITEEAADDSRNIDRSNNMLANRVFRNRQQAEIVKEEIVKLWEEAQQTLAH